MKLQAEIEGRQHEVQIERRGTQIHATIDDRSYELELRRVTAESVVLIHDAQIYDCLIGSDGQPHHLQVHVQSRSFGIRLIDPKRLRSGETAGSQNHGAARVLAVMPGKVVRVLVEVGAIVEAGAGIAVVEAMKMQNEIKTPKAGTVKTLNATPGATVNAGDVLAVIE